MITDRCDIRRLSSPAEGRKHSASVTVDPKPSLPEAHPLAAHRLRKANDVVISHDLTVAVRRNDRSEVKFARRHVVTRSQRTSRAGLGITGPTDAIERPTLDLTRRAWWYELCRMISLANQTWSAEGHRSIHDAVHQGMSSVETSLELPEAGGVADNIIAWSTLEASKRPGAAVSRLRVQQQVDQRCGPAARFVRDRADQATRLSAANRHVSGTGKYDPLS